MRRRFFSSITSNGWISSNLNKSKVSPVATEYLPRILTSQVYEAAIETQLQPAANLSILTQNEVLLKREDTQPVFSFKIRGAYNRVTFI